MPSSGWQMAKFLHGASPASVVWLVARESAVLGRAGTIAGLVAGQLLGGVRITALRCSGSGTVRLHRHRGSPDCRSDRRRLEPRAPDRTPRS